MIRMYSPAARFEKEKEPLPDVLVTFTAFASWPEMWYTFTSAPDIPLPWYLTSPASMPTSAARAETKQTNRMAAALVRLVRDIILLENLIRNLLLRGNYRRGRRTTPHDFSLKDQSMVLKCCRLIIDYLLID